MRLIDPETNKASRARRLSKRPPSRPAAVPIFDKSRRTDKLVFDFDTKAHGPESAERDVARLCAWLDECGGRWISDRNPSNGGRHVITPLASGEAFRRVNIEPLLRLLAARLPTLDLAPMLNAATGGITPPGSATRQGSHRQLDGAIEDAVAVFEKRSEPRLVARMRALLGDTLPHRPLASDTGEAAAHIAPVPSAPEFWEREAAQARLRPHWQLSSAMPAAPSSFAVTGVLPADGRYQSPSEARQAVLTASALRGLCLGDVQARMKGTGANAWPGLNDSYQAKYGNRASDRLAQDWANACRWVSLHIQVLRSPGHKTTRRHTPPRRELGQKNRAHVVDVYDRWLASAIEWIQMTWPGQPYRWTVSAVLQALAYGAKCQGVVGNDGTPLVDVGVRGLSLFAGLMPVTTIADVLAHIRDLPGSPIHRIRRAAGVLADQYSLIPARRYDDMEVAVAAVHIERFRVAPIHDAWRVLGLSKRLIYDLVAYGGLSRPADIFAAAHIGTRAGYDALAALKQAGLLRGGRGEVALGDTTLDDIAHHHGLHFERAERVAHYRIERRDWRRWLDIRYGLLPDPVDPRASPVLSAPWDVDIELNEAIWAAQLATGPPQPSTPLPPDLDLDDSREDDLLALALLQDELGAVAIT